VFSLRPLALDAAVTLFRLHATRSGARLRGSPDEDAHVAALVDQLDRLPLAIELAGGRAATLSPKQILERARGSLELLRRQAGGRVVSLEAALAVSFDLLDDVARAVLTAASAYVGPVAADAVERALEGEGRSAVDVLDALGARWWRGASSCAAPSTRTTSSGFDCSSPSGRTSRGTSRSRPSGSAAR
jgi:predicted ATPase